MKTFKTKMQLELEKMTTKLSYIDECKLKNEPVNFSLLQW